LTLFKQRKNKRYSYTPRQSKTNDVDGVKKDEFTSKWERARHANEHKTNMKIPMRTLLLLLVLLLICMYMLDKKFR